MSKVIVRSQKPAVFSRLVLGAYAWIDSAVLGLVVLDSVYARQLRILSDPSISA